jgi:hypothetical protein
MNGMDAVIQIRNGAVKGFSIYADKTWGCAARCPLRASPDAFHSTSKIRKSEVVPVNQGLLCCANLFGAARIFSGLRESFRGCANLFGAARIFSRLHGGVRIAQQPVDFRSYLRTGGPSLDSRVRGK